MLQPEATDEERIQTYLATLNEADQERQRQALSEGYKNEVCSKCKTVFLAFHHYVRCNEPQNCPMITRDNDGKPGPSVLHALLGPPEPKE